MVEDDDAIARAVGRLLARHRPTHHVSSVAAAKAALKDARHWTGLVVDIGLPDGSGLDVVSAARARWPMLPALVLTGSTQPSDINRSFALRADFLVKPGTPDEIDAFVTKAIARESIGDDRVVQVIDDVASEMKLTHRERDVLLILMSETRRPEVAKKLGVAENTAKTHVRTLLKKAQCQSLDELARMVFKRALAGGADTRAE